MNPETQCSPSHTDNTGTNDLIRIPDPNLYILQIKGIKGTEPSPKFGFLEECTVSCCCRHATKKNITIQRQTDITNSISTDRQTDRRTDRKTDRKTGKQTEKQANRQKNRQTDRYTDREKERQTNGQGLL